MAGARIYETDNGPGGVSWEVERDGAHVRSCASLGEAIGLAGRPFAVYGQATWQAAMLAEGDRFDGETSPDVCIGEGAGAIDVAGAVVHVLEGGAR